MTSSARTRIDVVIPCYKYAHYLEFCVGTVLSQRDVEVRILIVDDQSPDNTPEVAARLVAADSRVEYLRNEKNLGLVGSANRGVIDWASAPYILLLSADDALTPGALARAASVMERFPEVGVAYGMALVVAETEEMKGVEDVSEFSFRVMPGSEFLRQSCLHWCGVASPTALVRTSIQHEVGGLDPKLPHTCDMEIWMRIATRAAIAALDTTQAFYRRHHENMSIAYMSSPLGDLREQLATAESVFGKWAVGNPSAPDWLAAMKRRMVEQASWMAGLAFERGDDRALRECEAFIETLGAARWQSRAWLKLQARKLAGPSLTRFVRRQIGETDVFKTPFKHGELFGWWPEDQPGGSMRA